MPRDFSHTRRRTGPDADLSPACTGAGSEAIQARHSQQVTKRVRTQDGVIMEGHLFGVMPGIAVRESQLRWHNPPGRSRTGRSRQTRSSTPSSSWRDHADRRGCPPTGDAEVRRHDSTPTTSALAPTRPSACLRAVRSTKQPPVAAWAHRRCRRATPFIPADYRARLAE